MNNKLDILDMIEICTVKDGDEYSPGTYQDKVGVNGLYIKAKKGSLLERVENMAKQKFKLENDPEGYASEARLELWLSIMKFYEKFGEDYDRKPDGWVHTDVRYKLMDKAKLAKSNVSICDRKTGEYHINKIESFEQKFIEETDKIKNQRDEKLLSMLYNEETDAEFMDTPSTNVFVQWFKENAEFILTKKQLDWLNGDIIIDGMSSVWRIRKNICKKVEKAYSEDKIKTEKIKKLNKYQKSIDYLLDFDDEDDLKVRLCKMSSRKDGIIIIDLYKGMDMIYCETLTSLINSSTDELKDIECSKDFYYEVIDVLIQKEQQTQELIKNIENGDGKNGIR